MFRHIVVRVLQCSPLLAPVVYVAMRTNLPRTPQSAALRDNLTLLCLVACVTLAVAATAWRTRPQDH